MHILIIDDDFTSRKLLARGVRDLGSIDQACDGAEGWTAFQAASSEGHPYDLILLDIMMPMMDGGELLRKIRADERSRDITGPRRCRIAMATMLSDKESVLRSFRDEADGYILKPYSPGSVLRDLRSQNLAGAESAGMAA
jgi:two-component system, chemotaxis family, chemotaxis protein CheY